MKVCGLRNERGWSQDELARRSGLHRNTIRKIERTVERPDDVKPTTMTRLAGGFDLSPEELAALHEPPSVAQRIGDPRRGIPVINRAPASEPVDYEHMGLDEGIGSDYVPRIGSGVHDPTAFAFVVVGQSMSPEFRDGDVVVCSPESEIRDGDAAFVRFSSELDETCTFKRVYDRGDEVELVPDNRAMKPFRVSKEQIVRMSRAVAKWVRYD
jgi:SOS-response transcriptional repressor LexA